MKSGSQGVLEIGGGGVKYIEHNYGIYYLLLNYKFYKNYNFFTILVILAIFVTFAVLVEPFIKCQLANIRNVT